MELYGGGMTGKSNNYQLGGRIARSNLNRAVQGEQRKLERQYAEAEKKKSRAKGLGTILGGIGSLAGSLIPIPGVGTALGTAIGKGLGSGIGQLLGESTYQGTKVGDGRFLKDIRGDLQGSIDDFKSSLGERALATGLTKFLSTAASNFPGIKDELGIGTKAKAKAIRDQALRDNEFLVNELGDAVAADGTILKGGGEYTEDIMDFLPAEEGVRPDIPIGMQDFSDELISESGSFNLPTDGQFQLTPEQRFQRRFIEKDLQGLSDDPQFMDANSYVPFTDVDTGMPDIDYNYGDYSPWDDLNFIGPRMPQRRGGGLVNMMLPQMQTGGNVNPYGYGTMMDPMMALRQMGMGATADDPRLKQYMGELPQFGMGYAQQIGDIQTGGQQALRDMRGQVIEAAGQRGFSGSGIGKKRMKTSLGDLRADIDRQKRGVIEGFQGDLLSAIGNIEQAGQFEFNTGQTPYEKLGMTQKAYAEMLAKQAMGDKEITQFEEEEDDGMMGFTTRNTGASNTGGASYGAQSSGSDF